MNRSIHQMTTIAFCTALICVLAQLTIPIPVIPLTMQTFAVGLIATILPWKQSMTAVCLYVLMGAIGLPVYAAFTGGVGILFGPTGGYLLSFPLMAFIISIYLHRFGYSKIHAIVANVIGMSLNLIIGTVWLKWILQLEWIAAISSGLIPFLLVGVLKAIGAALVGLVLRNRLKLAHVLVK